ncbi:hypothetical protein [Oleiphilus messinensis]|nr:hypothetical protein [Oleiphilus messinensis]
MAQEIEQQNKEIITLLDKYPEGISRGKIAECLSFTLNDKTLQRRLLALVDEGRVGRKGERKATRYYPIEVPKETFKGHVKDKNGKQYGVVKSSLGEIDPFRIQYRQQRKAIMGQIVRQGLHGPAVEKIIENYCQQQEIIDLDKFTAMTLADLSTLHAGAIVGLGITEAQFELWLSGKG